YTRYGDDLALSGDRMDAGRALWVVLKVIASEGFTVHAGKVRVMRAHQRQTLAGLVVNERPQGQPRRVRRSPGAPPQRPPPRGVVAEPRRSPGLPRPRPGADRLGGRERSGPSRATVAHGRRGRLGELTGDSGRGVIATCQASTGLKNSSSSKILVRWRNRSAHTYLAATRRTFTPASSSARCAAIARPSRYQATGSTSSLQRGNAKPYPGRPNRAPESSGPLPESTKARRQSAFHRRR